MKNNKIFLNKMLLIFVFFVIVVSACFSNVKASSTKYITANNVTYTLPDECTDNFFIFEGFDNTLRLVYGNFPDWHLSENNGDVVLWNMNGNNKASFFICDINKGSNDFSNPIKKFTSTWTSINPSKNVSYAGCHIYFSSNDLYYPSGEIFFQKTPVPVLVEVMSPEVVEKKTVQEILGVLPLIIAVVVSFLGLRKALKMLSTFLNRS